jgi:transposase InsO family protein
VEQVEEKMELSERRACSVLEQPRMTQRYKPKQQDKDKVLVAAMKRLASKHQRYGYRFITAKLRQEGWQVNKKRVQRLWRKEGLQVPYRRKIKKSQGSSENACFVKKAEFINHVWTYDFIEDQTEDGRKLKFLTVLDEWTRESTAIEVDRSIRAKDVIAVLEYLFTVRGAPGYIRSDNGPEFIADVIRQWLKDRSVGPLSIEPGSPWENGYAESFQGRFRDELLDRELFYSVKEAKVLVENWRLEYNHHRPHSSLDYMTPAAFAAACLASAPAGPAPPPNRTENVDNSLIILGT